jgi:predicted DNA-binding transcriptional regulator YafY
MDEHTRYDRQARLLDILHYFTLHPEGLKPRQIADRCGVSIRTTYRDLEALQEHMHVPLWQDTRAGIWGLEPGAYLPPIAFSRPEAMAIFLAARLLLAQHRVYNPDIATTFRKLSAVLDPPLREEVRKTLEWMEKRKADARLVNALNTLTDCWLRRKRARIRYWTLGRAQPAERTIEPYFIHPSVLSNATYVIAFCHLRRRVLVFRLDRVEDARRLEEDYVVPEEFNASAYLSPYFDITTTGEPETVKLKFDRRVARIAFETMWHDSQVTEPQTDGSAIVTMKLAVTTDVVSFVLGWSDMVEVLKPASLRHKVARAARRIQSLYQAEAETLAASQYLVEETAADSRAAREACRSESVDRQLNLFAQCDMPPQ